MNARSGLLAHALALLRHARVLGLVGWDGVLEQLKNALELCVCSAVWIWEAAVLGILFFEFLPLWISSVASPPSSTRKSQPSAPGTVIICSVHHQYSGSVSPFQAKTVDVPALAMPAATWS